MSRSIARTARMLLVCALFACLSACGAADSGPVDPLAGRDYFVHLPPSYGGVTKMALVIVLHGSGATASGMEPFTGFSVKADQNGFIVVYPQGIGGEWDVFGDRDVDFISALIDLLATQYSIDTARVFATGHSLGAMLSYRLAFRLPAKIAAVGPVSGVVLYGQPRPREPVSIIHIHAYNDGALLYNGGRYGGVRYDSVEQGVAYWCAVNACDPTPVTLYQNGDVSGRLWRSPYGKDVVLYAGNWGHNWPAQVTTTQSTTDLIWDFFATHGK